QAGRLSLDDSGRCYISVCQPGKRRDAGHADSIRNQDLAALRVVSDRARIREPESRTAHRRVAQDSLGSHIAVRGAWENQGGVIAVVGDPQLVVRGMQGKSDRAGDTRPDAAKDAGRLNVAAV